MSFKEHFAEELSDLRTSYFILDTRGGGEHGDIDFVQYKWSRDRYNRVNEGDLFVYRRPGKVSRNGEFFFFGAGKIGPILGSVQVASRLQKPYPLQGYIYKSELGDFQWRWKTRVNSWEHFFNQYGINKIFKEDFVALLNLSEEESAISEYDPEAATEAAQAMQSGHYSVDDREGKRRIRSKQQYFSNQVKASYGNKCAICKIHTKAFLISSHIVPWTIRKDIRLDPSNGICLCTFHDTAFDKGYITIDEQYRVKIAHHIEDDRVLSKLLKPLKGKKIFLPKVHKPKAEYLKYHRERIFEKYLKKQ
jgi:putative restriction endonuclease